MVSVYICLVHHPVNNQNNQVITTSITNLDVHDIARLTSTYDLAGYYIVQPLNRQRELFQELIDYWKQGLGAQYNSSRAEAFQKVKVVATIEECLNDVTHDKKPIVVATGANLCEDIDFIQLRQLMKDNDIVILFGTGWGLTDEVTNKAHFRLTPIKSIDKYNHLSVRSAASIIIDRLCCKKWW
ncbi:MAG: hypothetical protein APF76_04975 [Desulfitibacter sp. BRH_c19]|nr:MAG: hypothetical protein APF76_04975 [Desulfitibacter sp. BRH_c19]